MNVENYLVICVCMNECVLSDLLLYLSPFASYFDRGFATFGRADLVNRVP